jgi:hypothetical protein
LDFTKLELGKWNNQATADPDSLAAQLRGMVTPEYFALMEFAALSSANMLSTKYQDGSCQVQHVALLSARTWEYSDTENDSEDQKDEANVQNEQTNSPTDVKDATAGASDATNSKDKDKPISRVAAQLEVVYEHTETFTPIRLVSRDPTADSSTNTETHESNTASTGNTTMTEGDVVVNGEDSPTEEGEELLVTKTSTLVGVFEGWIQGDPSGNENLRWRLCVSRPAWEFYDSSY